MTYEQKLYNLSKKQLIEIICNTAKKYKNSSKEEMENASLDFILAISEEICEDARLMKLLEQLFDKKHISDNLEPYGGKKTAWRGNDILLTLSFYGYSTIKEFEDEDFEDILDAMGY